MEPKTKSCLLVSLKWTAIVLFSIALLVFLVIFVVFPLVFMNTLSLQRFLVFTNIDQPKNPEYENYAKYDARGVRNFYVNVKDLYDETLIVSLGVWNVVHESRIEASEREGFDFMEELRTTQHPVLIYMHGQGGTRIFTLPLYNKLRKFFHIVAVDYRSYADSTKAELSEPAVVNDCVQFYKHIKSITDQRKIYVWGHSLGTGISTHTLAKLKEENIRPMGLMLESPFTTLADEVYYHPIAKVFKWLAYFEATIVNPLEDNGFHFKTTTNIKKVDCPIMIVHAADDVMIPVMLGQKLFEVAQKERDPEHQGPAFYHEIPSNFRCNHLEIYKWPALPEKVQEFMAECDKFENGIV